jgi:hypothetical protein
MTHAEAQKILDKIVGQVFGYQNPLSLEQFQQKFTFDIKLPQPVIDSTDGSTTWAQSVNPTKFIKMENARTKDLQAKPGEKISFLRPSRPLGGIQDVMAAWNEINITTAERWVDSVNVTESDNIDSCENVFRSQDIRRSRNVLFSDGSTECEFIAANQRSRNSTFCIRLDDSGECTNCFNVSWSGNLTNCLFMHDCGDMQDSMFCTNVSGERFCIANMQYPEAEYRRLRDEVVRWILSPA